MLLLNLLQLFLCAITAHLVRVVVGAITAPASSSAHACAITAQLSSPGLACRALKGTRVPDLGAVGLEDY